MEPTDDVEFKDVSPRAVGVGDLDAVGGDERLVDAAHDVDLRPLGQLLLAPDDREVEQRVRRAAERALEPRRSALLLDVVLRVRQQRHVVQLAAAGCNQRVKLAFHDADTRGVARNFIWGGGINFKSFQFQNQQQFVLGQRDKKQSVTT